MKKFLLLFCLLFAIPLASVAQEGPLTSVGGVMCGVSSDPAIKAVPTGTYTYLFTVNSVEIVAESVDLDLKLQYLLCTKLNNQFTWVRLNRLPGLYAYTQRLHKSGDKWKAKGYWDTAVIEDTTVPLDFNVHFSKMKLKKLLTKEEYASWQAGKVTEAYLKLDLSSEKYSYFIGGYMILKLTLLPNNGIEAVNIL